MRLIRYLPLYRRKDSYALFKKGIVGRLVQATRDKNTLLDLMSTPKVRTSSRVLDVGCGAGASLSRLRASEILEVPSVHTRMLRPRLGILSKTIEDLEAPHRRHPTSAPDKRRWHESENLRLCERRLSISTTCKGIEGIRVKDGVLLMVVEA